MCDFQAYKRFEKGRHKNRVIFDLIKRRYWLFLSL